MKQEKFDCRSTVSLDEFKTFLQQAFDRRDKTTQEAEQPQ